MRRSTTSARASRPSTSWSTGRAGQPARRGQLRGAVRPARHRAAHRRASGHGQRPRAHARSPAPTAPSSARSSQRRARRPRSPDVGVTINSRRGDDAYRFLVRRHRAATSASTTSSRVLILAGAAFAAFNLTGRIVEAQRREIGIGMALGVPRRRLAIRPLLVGAEVALARASCFGVGVGLVVGVGMGSVLQALLPAARLAVPVPAWRLRCAAPRSASRCPFVATAFPVWRAVRVPPVDAIRTGVLSAKSSGLAPLLARVPLPGRTTAQMPFRNVLRAPRRTLMTVLGDRGRDRRARRRRRDGRLVRRDDRHRRHRVGQDEPRPPRPSASILLSRRVAAGEQRRAVPRGRLSRALPRAPGHAWRPTATRSTPSSTSWISRAACGSRRSKTGLPSTDPGSS